MQYNPKRRPRALSRLEPQLFDFRRRCVRPVRQQPRTAGAAPARRPRNPHQRARPHPKPSRPRRPALTAPHRTSIPPAAARARTHVSPTPPPPPKRSAARPLRSRAGALHGAPVRQEAVWAVAVGAALRPRRRLRACGGVGCGEGRGRRVGGPVPRGLLLPPVKKRGGGRGAAQHAIALAVAARRVGELRAFWPKRGPRELRHITILRFTFCFWRGDAVESCLRECSVSVMPT